MNDEKCVFLLLKKTLALINQYIKFIINQKIDQFAANFVLQSRW